MAPATEYAFGDDWFFLRCRGCHAISIKHEYWHSADLGPDDKPSRTTEFFPSRVSRKTPDWQNSMDFIMMCPIEVNNLLHELYICLRNGCAASATMLVRSILEQMMIEKVGDHGSFKANLAQLQTHDFVSGMQREFIETALEAGHASIHRAYVPSPMDLTTLVDILEGIIQAVYVHSNQASVLKKRIPPRSTAIAKGKPKK